MEARQRALQRLERHRAGDVRRLGEPEGARQPERCHRRHELRAVDQRETLLRLQPHGRQTGAGECLGARHTDTVDEGLPLADERQREMRERGQVAARAHRAPRGHVGDDPRVEDGEEQLDGLDPGARVALRDRVRPQHHRGAHDLVGIRLPHPAGVAAQQAQLQLLGLLLRDRLRDEAAEARVDPVGVLAPEPVDERPRACHPLDRALRERDRPTADRDVPDVLDREVVTCEREQTGHGSRV